VRLERWLSFVLAALGLVNAWSAWRTWNDERLPALFNAASAAVLLLFAVTLWRWRGPQR